MPNLGKAGLGPRLREGMVLAIEPMLSFGGPDIKTQDDHWTVVTLDGTRTAHFEHTIAVTSGDPRILTATQVELPA